MFVWHRLYCLVLYSSLTVTLTVTLSLHLTLLLILTKTTDTYLNQDSDTSKNETKDKPATTNVGFVLPPPFGSQEIAFDKALDDLFGSKVFCPCLCLCFCLCLSFCPCRFNGFVHVPTLTTILSLSLS